MRRSEIESKAGVQWQGWHAFRRGTATTLHEHGIDDKTIQSVMRHGELRTTQNIYIKTDIESARDGLQNVGESFRPRNLVNIETRRSA